MPPSNSRLAFQDCINLFDSALAAKKGIRTACGDKGDAYHLRVRLNNARKIDRADNAKTYEEGHMLYGRSIYDNIMVTIKQDTDDNYWIYLRKIDATNYVIEELEEENGIDESINSDHGTA